MFLQFTLIEQEVRNGFTLAGLCPPDAEQCYAAGSLPLITLLLKPWSRLLYTSLLRLGETYLGLGCRRGWICN